MHLDVRPGRPLPLGAHWDGAGVHFALRSGVATRVELCLYDPAAPLHELARLELARHDASVFCGYVAGLAPGALYGFRVHGPWEPEAGKRCNPNKLLIDPYARALHGDITWNASTRGNALAHVDADLLREDSDSAPHVPRAVVVDERFDWGDDQPPRTPWAQTVIYELHVRGFSKQQTAIAASLRGSYAALAEPASIAHLQELGVTAVELLPIHAFVDDAFLIDRGLRNYWGYSPLCFFAPAQRYASEPHPGAAVTELKRAIKALHRAGIEVLLDVVYNHTCEGSDHGPTLSLRGIDNAGYYALSADGRKVQNLTGCGNTLDAAKPAAGDLILASLRYWVETLHVDGFRFDLATTLGRDHAGHYDRASELLQRLTSDPVLAQCKLIAEPWDLGPGGYRLGEFPAPFSEWNDKFRDAARRLWRGADVTASELADRLFGSPDLFAERSPQASINYVTAHDGFTLRDLVSYERKHNLDNGEHNRDGSDHNESVHHGVEGDTSDPQVVAARLRHQRSLLATLCLAQGVPMLLAGDELGRTQCGNNNAYCQDNALSWLDWSPSARKTELLAFTRRALALRRQHPELRQACFLRGPTASGGDALRWFHGDGADFRDDDWSRPVPACFGFSLAPDAQAAPTLLVLFNVGEEACRFALPSGDWQLVLSSGESQLLAGPCLDTEAGSLVVCARRAAPGA